MTRQVFLYTVVIWKSNLVTFQRERERERGRQTDRHSVLSVCWSILLFDRPSEFNPFPKQALAFTCLQYNSFENNVGKGEIARNEQFLLFPQCFYRFGELSAIFTKFKIVVCKLFRIGRVQNLSFGKELNHTI